MGFTPGLWSLVLKCKLSLFGLSIVCDMALFSMVPVGDT